MTELRIPTGFNGVGLHDTPGASVAAWAYAESAAHARLLREHGVTLYKILADTANKAERCRAYVDDGGLANATRLIMTENPGRGDSVAELDSLWQGMTVFQIYETILAEKSACTQVAGPWSEIRAGANANIFLPPAREVPRVGPWSEIRAGANANIFLPPAREVPRVGPWSEIRAGANANI